MGTILEGLEDHEGYAERPVEDPIVADVYVAACGCGWRGGRHNATDEGYDGAVEEWERVHAGPLLASTVPAEVRHLINELTSAVGQLIEDRPLAGLEALRRLAAWAEVSVARLQLAARSRPQPERGRSLGL